MRYFKTTDKEYTDLYAVATSSEGEERLVVWLWGTWYASTFTSLAYLEISRGIVEIDETECNKIKMLWELAK